MKWLILLGTGTLSGIWSIFYLYAKKTSVDVPSDPTEPDPIPAPQNAPIEPVIPPTQPLPPKPPIMDFSTPKAAWHSVRLICDEMGLPLIKNVTVNGVKYFPKDIICSCVFQESRFNNKAVGKNAHSADWGICQINDKIWAGPGEPFSSAQDIVDHPEKAVRFMVHMYQKGKLSLWVSYSSGVYRQWLIHTSPMWELAQ